MELTGWINVGCVLLMGIVALTLAWRVATLKRMVRHNRYQVLRARSMSFALANLIRESALQLKEEKGEEVYYRLKFLLNRPGVLKDKANEILQKLVDADKALAAATQHE